MTLGFRELEDLVPVQIQERYFANRGDPLGDNGGHVVRATTV